MSSPRHSRAEAFFAVASTQPGSTAYDNHRPIFVRRRSAQQPLQELLRRIAPYADTPHLMQDHLERGWLLIDGKRPHLDQILVAGNIVTVVVPQTVEPKIAPELGVLFEDEHLLVLDKPSPLPVHPCGRYNRNTLVSIAKQAWPDITLKPVHRLDANTTGIMVCAKTKPGARGLMAAFQAQRVQKTYAARVWGELSEVTRTIDAAIDPAPTRAGARQLSTTGQPSRTVVTRWHMLGDGTSILRVTPETGRTHQIRLHLHSIGLPIVGDTVYGVEAGLDRGLTSSNQPLCLHAAALTFPHPCSHETMSFQAPLPAHFQATTRPDDDAPG